MTSPAGQTGDPVADLTELLDQLAGQAPPRAAPARAR